MPRDWRKREKQVLRELGFTATPGSGNTFLGREDGETPNLLAQVKSTDGATITVKRQDLKDLAYHSYRAQRRKPVFIADFGEGEVWVMCRPEDLGLLARGIEAFRKNEKRVNESNNSDV